MRKLFILILIIIPVLGFGDLNVGIKGGLSMNHMWGDDWDLYFNSNPTWEKKFRLGFSVGGFISVDIMKNVALQPEVYFSLIGGGFNETASGAKYENKQQIFVVEIPILFSIRLPLKKLRVNVFGGPEIMVYAGKYKVINDPESGPEQETEWDELYINKVFFGLAMGIGIDIPITQKIFALIDVRYTVMLTNIFDSDWYSFNEQRSNSIKFMGGVGFKIN